MKWFTSFVTAICASSICLGALYIICPKGKMEKSVKYIFSLCFLLIIIAAAGITVKKADFKFNSSFESTVDAAEIQIAAAKYTYGLALKNAGIDFSQISVYTDNLSDGSISISKVVIYSGCDRQRIIAALGAAAENFEVEVVNE
ncbi:MAG: hypothetical protein ACOYJS_07040 [Acutalibacteraceae bacterium]|jgi:hypothetical protein